MSIDNRIVNMEFNNKQFTTAANATMGVLSKLGEKLQLSEGLKGLSNISNKAKQVDMSGLEDSVMSVEKRFSMLDVVGVTALVNIANAAFDTGKRFVKSLTVDPITDGLAEYETKMQAIQTIMTNTSSKGTTMDQVNDALADLNDYSDKTIYNFAQMTENIGKATAAGVGLGDSVTFVKGLANVAAGFGVDAQRMAGATQQMTQALSSGTIRLQDWISMESAGMGGQMIQDALMDTAEEMGIYIDKSVPFRATLEQNWLSSDVFIKTMEKMAKDQSLIDAATKVTTFTKLIGNMKEVVGSGWAVSWEHILGNKEQSTDLFTSIGTAFSNLSNSMSNYRNDSLALWNTNGGREAVLNGLKNILSSISKVLKPIYDAYIKILDPWNSDRLISISKGFENLTKKLTVTEKTSGYIKTTFEGIFSAFKLVGIVLKPVLSLFGGLTSSGASLFETFFKFTSILTGWITKVVEAVEASKSFESINKVMGTIGESLGKVINAMTDGLDKLLDSGFDKISEYMDGFIKGTGGVITKFGEYIGHITGFIKSLTGEVDLFKIASFVIVEGFKSIQTGIESFLTFLERIGKAIGGFFGNILGGINDSGVLTTDIVSVGLFAGIYSLVKKLLPAIQNIGDGLGSFKEGFLGTLESLEGILTSYQKNIQAGTIQKIAISIGILAGALWVLSTIEPSKAASATATLAALMSGIMIVLKVFEKISPIGVLSSIGVVNLLIGLSSALLILSGAMLMLSKLTWTEIGKGLTGLAGASLILVGITKIIKDVKISPADSIAILGLAVSMTVLANAVKILGQLSVKEIIKGVGALAGVLAALSLFLMSGKYIKNANKVAFSLIPLSVSMYAFAGAIALLGNMDVGTLLQGLGVMGAVLALVSLFSALSGSSAGSMVKVGGSMLLLGAAMLVFSGALAILGQLDVATIVKGILTMASAMGIFGAISKVLSASSMIKISVGMGLIGASMIVLAAGLAAVGNLSLSTIAIGLLAVVAAIGLFAGASILLAPAIPLMLGLAGALALFGVACLATGIGITLLATGITALGASFAIGGGSILTLLEALIATVPKMLEAFAVGLVSLVVVLGNSVGPLTEALSKILFTLITVVNDNIPIFVETLVTLINSLLKAIKDITPVLVDTILSVLVSILKGLRDNIPIIVRYVMETLLLLIDGLLSELNKAIPKIARSIVKIINTILTTIGDSVNSIVNAMFDLVISIVNGLANAVTVKMPQVRQAIKRLLTAIKNEFFASIGDFNGIGNNIMDGIKNGISNGVIKVKNAIVGVAKNALGWARDVLGIHSPSKEFAKIGMYTDEGLAQGLTKNAGLVKTGAEKVAETALDSMKNAMLGVNDLISSDPNSQPVIAPVLDLTNIQNGMQGVDGIMKGQYGIQASVSRAAIASNHMNSKTAGSLNGLSNISNSTNNSAVSNTFNITGSNPREIAEEVSRIIQNQVERRDTVWA